jgi:hypothetical protein
MKSYYRFFGIETLVELKDSLYKNQLIEDIEIYKIDERTNNTNFLKLTDDWSKFEQNFLSRNPSIHFYHKNVIYIDEKLINIAFVFDDEKKLKTIFFKLKYAKSIFRRGLRKWLNMQFTNRLENVGQIIHEQILVPLTFFYQNKVPIHASGVSKENKAVLFGGTGGVGKTSIELELCLKESYGFTADDIAIGDVDGVIFSNYNSPKIYGYNAEGNPLLRKKIFQNQDVLSKIHWKLHKTIFGLAKVRRKIKPSSLFENVAIEKEALSHYLMLFRSRQNKITVHKLTNERASKMTVAVIFAEYAYFMNHLKWHQFNALGNGIEPIITVEELKERWQKNTMQLLSTSLVKQVNIPIEINHNQFKSEIVTIIKKVLKNNQR